MMISKHPQFDTGIKACFRSFIMGGFECADHLNAFGERVDLVKLTGHDQFLSKDYEMLRHLNITSVREGVRWSVVEKSAFQYDWSWLENIVQMARKHNMQIIWDICHFGFPDDLTPLHPMFARRFAHLCQAFVRKYREISPEGELIVVPINEVSFLSWLGGDVRGTSPFCVGQGWEVKYRLMKAYIEGIEMMREVDTQVLIMTTEPLINIIPADPTDQESVAVAEKMHAEQFQVLDILSGRLCSELRGKPEYVDIIGLNFYYNNQWTVPDHQHIPWNEGPPHPLWKSLHALVEEVYCRYKKPVLIAETSHPGEDRPLWLRKVGEQCISILDAGIPLQGLCIYPIIDRPDWDITSYWHHSGLWDIENPETLDRLLHVESLHVIDELKVKIDHARFRDYRSI